MNRSYINTASFASFLSKKTKLGLNNSKIFTILFLMLVFCGKMEAQCEITEVTVLSSSRTCSSFSSCTTITIGNGTNPTSLVLDGNFDLNSCFLNPIQLIVNNNANIDFTVQNYDLRLPAGSSITFIGNGTLLGPLSGNCSNSDRIFIGTTVVSTCLGAGLPLTFPELVNQGGYNIVNISPTSASACGSGSFSFTATAIPSATATEVRWYSVASGGTPLQTTSGNSSTYTTPVISTTTTYYAEATIGAFITPRKAVVATVNVLPTTPTVGSIIQPTCTAPTGTITISEPTGMNYSIDGLTYTNNTGIFDSLAPGTYSVTAKNPSGCISNATSVTIKNSTNIWNGSSWSNVTEPIITENIEFAGTYSENKDVVGCSCQVNNAVFVTISANRTLTLTNGLNVIGSGTLAFIDSASLLQSNTAPNINFGYIDYKRSTSARITDYTYWSSPVSPMSLGELVYPVNGTYYSYEATATGEGWKPEGSGTNMDAGKGYIANRGTAIPSAGYNPPSIALNVIFTGVPNNGNIPVSVYSGKSCLLGNPYPSAIDADLFLTTNSSFIEGTIYFWTHNTAIQDATNITDGTAGSGAFAYTSNDYASYNSTGGVAGSNGVVPSGKIAAGQGFFATSIATGTVNFTNTMRLAGNNSQFFKKRNSKTEKFIEKNRIWLNLTNTQGAFKQTLVGYITGATNDYDDRFDGESFDGNEFVDFYSLNQDKNLVIQGRALPFDENDEIPLGYRTTINGDFTINIDQADGLLTNQAVFLEDKLTQKVFDLKSGNYTFNTVAGTFNDRFVLRYKDNSTAKTLGKPTVDTIENKVLVSNKNKQIKINSNSETIDKVMVYDVLGKLMYKKDKVNTQEVIISNLTAKNQVLIVKTTLQNGKTVTDKIVN